MVFREAINLLGAAAPAANTAGKLAEGVKVPRFLGRWPVNFKKYLKERRIPFAFQYSARWRKGLPVGNTF